MAPVPMLGERRSMPRACAIRACAGEGCAGGWGRCTAGNGRCDSPVGCGEPEILSRVQGLLATGCLRQGIKDNNVRDRGRRLPHDIVQSPLRAGRPAPSRTRASLTPLAAATAIAAPAAVSSGAGGGSA